MNLRRDGAVFVLAIVGAVTLLREAAILVGWL